MYLSRHGYVIKQERTRLLYRCTEYRGTVNLDLYDAINKPEPAAALTKCACPMKVKSYKKYVGGGGGGM